MQWEWNVWLVRWSWAGNSERDADNGFLPVHRVSCRPDVGAPSHGRTGYMTHFNDLSNKYVSRKLRRTHTWMTVRATKMWRKFMTHFWLLFNQPVFRSYSRLGQSPKVLVPKSKLLGIFCVRTFHASCLTNIVKGQKDCSSQPVLQELFKHGAKLHFQRLFLWTLWLKL